MRRRNLSGIVTFGDSGPAGSDVRSDQAYPAVLQVALRAKGIDATVLNISAAGLKTDQGLASVGTIPQGTHIVITEFGSNDMRANVRASERDANMDAIVKRLRARGIEVVIMGTRGIDYSAIASANGATFVPYTPAFRSYIQASGKHLTPEGHRKTVEI